jgi:hypothetical protein
MPPSANGAVPLEYETLSEVRNAKQAATFSGSPHRLPRHKPLHRLPPGGIVQSLFVYWLPLELSSFDLLAPPVPAVPAASACSGSTVPRWLTRASETAALMTPMCEKA